MTDSTPARHLLRRAGTRISAPEAVSFPRHHDRPHCRNYQAHRYKRQKDVRQESLYRGSRPNSRQDTGPQNVDLCLKARDFTALMSERITVSAPTSTLTYGTGLMKGHRRGVRRIGASREAAV